MSLRDKLPSPPISKADSSPVDEQEKMGGDEARTLVETSPGPSANSAPSDCISQNSMAEGPIHTSRARASGSEAPGSTLMS